MLFGLIAVLDRKAQLLDSLDPSHCYAIYILNMASVSGRFATYVWIFFFLLFQLCLEPHGKLWGSALISAGVVVTSKMGRKNQLFAQKSTGNGAFSALGCAIAASRHVASAI